MRGGYERGQRSLTVAQQTDALEMLRAGKSQEATARRFHVTKNVIAGLWHRQGEPESNGPEPTTLFDRCDALHAKFDAVVKAIGTVPRVPNVVKMGR